MNNEYLVWAALFLVVAGGALVWIVFAELPEIDPDVLWTAAPPTEAGAWYEDADVDERTPIYRSDRSDANDRATVDR